MLDSSHYALKRRPLIIAFNLYLAYFIVCILLADYQKLKAWEGEKVELSFGLLTAKNLTSGNEGKNNPEAQAKKPSYQ